MREARREEKDLPKREESEREKERINENVCKSFVWSVGWFFMLSEMVKSLSRDMIGHFRKINYIRSIKKRVRNSGETF